MAGPVGDIFSYENYWELVAYSEKGSHRNLEDAVEFRYLAIPNNSVTGSERIDLFNKDKNKVASWEHTSESFDVNSQRSVGKYIKRTKEGKYFRATVYVKSSIGEVYELRLSNLMYQAYKVENDTLLFTYKPIDKF